MRNRPAFTGQTALTLVPGRRPPLEVLPEPMVDLLRRRDEVNERLGAAVKALSDLNEPERDAEAAAEDAKAATTAALAGKAVPEPKGAKALADKRAKATRELAAYESAMNAVSVDCDALRGDVQFDRSDEYQLPDNRPALLAAIMPKVDAVIAQLEKAVAEVAVREWWHYHPYDPRPVLWRDGIPVDIRTTLINAVADLLITEE